MSFRRIAMGFRPTPKEIPSRFLSRLVLAVFGLLFAASAWAGPPAFPLKPSPNGRYLVDSAGVPFFFYADTSWMLMTLKPDDARAYLDARRAQGFTALQIQLTGFMATRDYSGASQFLGDNDLGRPNEEYFAHADQLIRDATDRGFALAIAPLWSGCCGEGWAGTEKDGRIKPLNTAGPNKARQLGRRLGERYAKFPNIIWIMGGDHNPDGSFEEIKALARGIHEAAPNHLMTVHNAPDHSSADFYEESDWLTLNAAYSYRELQAPVYREWQRKGKVRPVFLIESGYEHEANDKRPGTPFRIRRQAYATVLNGGLAGHAYGNRDVWRFNHRWREALNDPGSRQLSHFKDLFTKRPWWGLEPDQGDSFVTDGRGKIGQDDYVSVARSPDGKLAIAYLPTGRAVTLDLARLGGPSQAHWFDPSNGSTQDARATPAEGRGRFTPPGPNSSGDSDWVLVLERTGPDAR